MLKVDTAMFHRSYAEVFAGDAEWQAIAVPKRPTYAWQEDSTYVQHPPFFENIADAPPHMVTSTRRASSLCWVTR